MRCIALAQAWRERGGRVEFLSRCDSKWLRKRIRQEGFKLVAVKSPHPCPEDYEQTINCVQKDVSEHSPWLILDGYHFDPAYQRAVREAQINSILIDDHNHHSEYHPKILLNQNIHAPGLQYVCDADTVQLAGVKYVLLRREFLRYRSRGKAQPEKARKILVTLGGADPENVTLKVLRALQMFEHGEFEVRIVVGPDNPHLQSLEQELKGFEHILILHNPDIPSLMTWADLAVSAGGSTCWELAFMGVPFLAITMAQNQEELAAGLDAESAAVNLGWFHEIDLHNIVEAVEELVYSPAERARLSRKGWDLVDGLGVDRILTVMRWLEPGVPAAEPLVRPVEPGDVLQLWRLANDKDVRRNAFNPEPIPLENHLKWFGEKLESTESAIYVSEIAGVVVAQARYDKKQNSAEIDYAVIPACRGKGLGRRIIEATWSRACTKLKVNSVRGVVKKDNAPSLYCFRKAGFRQTGEENVSGIDCLIFERECKNTMGKQ
jgi:UDP-2,4-diacetamido-2,4,6-trideoxy-beta-L-altropyranose hydrolase